MWIREFEIEIDEEEEEKENEENEEEEDEEEEDEEEEEEEDSDEIKISKKNRKKFKLNRNVKSLLSLKENNDKDNKKMQSFKEKIKNEIDNLRKKYNDNNIISVEFSSDENAFNIYRRLAMFKHSNIFLYPFFLEGQGIYVKEFISMKSENGQKYGAIVNENLRYYSKSIKSNKFLEF